MELLDDDIGDEVQEAIDQMKPGDVITVGNHVYALCPKCGRLVKLTGFFKGIHLCTED